MVKPTKRNDVLQVQVMSKACKAGFAASALVAAFADHPTPVLFFNRIKQATGDTYLEANDRVQVYVNGDLPPGELTSWTELEFTAPVGKQSSLTVEWTLVPTTREKIVAMASGDVDGL
jgi:ribosomal protein S2